MHKRGLTVALVAVLTLIFVFGAVGVAFAQWTDLTMSILGDYGVTEQQVANISDGFPDGTWRPYQAMPRNQFAKMAVDAYKIPLVSPATPTYSDVPASDYFYAYIEGATAAGLTNGVGGGKFEPYMTVTREQAAAIISRWVADQNGYNIETMYTDADAAAILASFPDAAAVSPSLLKEMAFAVDFGIVWGDASGLLAPKTGMSRIQGAAMLIRSLDIIPMTEPVVPAKIELMSDDEAENLIGLTHQYTYLVTQADGSPAPGVLVDFDTLIAPWYVGNVEPEAALTDENGEVTINLISTEVGIQRVSAAAPGVAAIWSTKYWLALDEVYILADPRSAQNNAGTTHTWSARVLVFGPGPLSTSQSDWYNLYDPAGDPSQPLQLDGVDAGVDYDVDYSQYANEVDWLADGYLGRSMLGIPVFWQIQNVVNDDPKTTVDETVASVGKIVAALEDGEIAADGKSAWASTDADGLTSIDIMSEATGKTVVTAEANYDGNPYEWQLFDHQTNNDFEEHFYDWQDQPSPYASAVKTWIPHTIGGTDGPIAPAHSDLNVGEEKLLTITLKDSFGNPVAGRTVEWFMKGVGMFKEDDDRTQSGDNRPWWNVDDRDIDITDANGTARVLVKSLDPGEQLVIAEVRDKGTGGHEGINLIYEAEVQWFKVDVATFDKPVTKANEAVSINEVNTEHTFDLWVYGLKLEYFPALGQAGDGMYNKNNQTSWIDTDVSGKAYDGIMDADDAKYLDAGGILLVNEADAATALSWAKAVYDPTTGTFDNPATLAVETAKWVADVDGVARTTTDDITLGKGGITAYDWNGDGIKETVAASGLMTGIYLPLKGKGVDFDNIPVITTAGTIKAAGIAGSIVYAGVTYTYDAITDAAGHAFVTVTSQKKGDQWVEAVVNYPANPHKGTQLKKAQAHKIWTTQAAPVPQLKVTVDGLAADPGAVAGPNPIFDINGQMNAAHIEVHVLDQFGNELPDYEVVYELVGLGEYTKGTQGSGNTFIPWTVLTDLTPSGTQAAASAMDERFPEIPAPLTNSAANQLYPEFTSVGTSHTGTFNAETTRTGTWAWELAVTGLANPASVVPAKRPNEKYMTYTLWAANVNQTTGAVIGAPVELGDFVTDASGTIPGGKVFGNTSTNLSAYNSVLVTAEETLTDVVPGPPFVLGGKLAVVGVQDGNGVLPDNSEPRDDNADTYQDGVGPKDGSTDSLWADPLARIVGKGGTEAYYFWRDAKNPPENNFATIWGDGAKAWTLNGIEATKPHGSSIDLWLQNPLGSSSNPYRQDPRVTCKDHIVNIVNIQVYAPDNGPTFDGTPVWTFEIQKEWKPAVAAGFVATAEQENNQGGWTTASVTNPLGSAHTARAVLPAGADSSEMYFQWVVTGANPSMTGGFGMTSRTYFGGVAGTDTITMNLFVADPAKCPDLKPAATYSLTKVWSGVAVGLWNYVIPFEGTPFYTTDPASNPVGTNHTVRGGLTGWAGAASDLHFRFTAMRGGVQQAQSGFIAGTAGTLPDSSTGVYADWTYSNTVAGSDTITAVVYLADNTTVVANLGPVTKNWTVGAPAKFTGEQWAVKDLVLPPYAAQYRFDSRYDQAPSVIQPAGTPLVFAVNAVRDQYNNILYNVDVSAYHPKIMTRLWVGSAITPTVGVFMPVSNVTSAGQGSLYWWGDPAAGNGYLYSAVSGDRANVTFWFDLDDDGTINTQAEIDTITHDPMYQWQFGG